MHVCAAVAIWPLLVSTTIPLQADAPQSVAGRSLQQWSADLDDPNEFVRLRAIRSLRAFGRPAIPAVVQALDDPHVGVQYWAASHLGDFATAPRAAVAVLQSRRDGENEAVAMAAAYALCRIQGPDGNIDLLISRLQYPERGMACSAAEFLGRLGPAGKSAVPALEEAYRSNDKKPGSPGPATADYHIRGAAQNALRLILGTWEPQ